MQSTIHCILYFPFSSAHSGWCENNFSAHSLSNFLHRSQCTFSLSLPYLFLNWFPAVTEHEMPMWVTLSTFSLQILHIGCTLIIPLFTEFFCNACSWAAHLWLSVCCFNSPAFNHCHTLWSVSPPFLSKFFHAILCPSILFFFLSFVALYCFFSISKLIS